MGNYCSSKGLQLPDQFVHLLFQSRVGRKKPSMLRDTETRRGFRQGSNGISEKSPLLLIGLPGGTFGDVKRDGSRRTDPLAAKIVHFLFRNTVGQSIHAIEMLQRKLPNVEVLELESHNSPFFARTFDYGQMIPRGVKAFVFMDIPSTIYQQRWSVVDGLLSIVCFF
jgi:hypothetical protein